MSYIEKLLATFEEAVREDELDTLRLRPIGGTEQTVADAKRALLAAVQGEPRCQNCGVSLHGFTHKSWCPTPGVFAAPVAPPAQLVAYEAPKGYTVADADLARLLDLTDALASGRGNMDVSVAWGEALDKVMARLSAPPAQPADGWVMVPRVATEDMLFAAEMSKPRGYRDLFIAMIAAAPAAPAAQPHPDHDPIWAPADTRSDPRLPAAQPNPLLTDGPDSRAFHASVMGAPAAQPKCHREECPHPAACQIYGCSSPVTPEQQAILDAIPPAPEREGGAATREHIPSADCWCQPEVDYVDPVTGNTVYVHRRPQ